MIIKADFFRFFKNKMNVFLLVVSSGIAVLTFLVSWNSKRPVTIGLQNLLGTNGSHPTSFGNSMTEMLHASDMVLLFMLYLIFSFWLSDFDNGRVRQLYLVSGNRFVIYIKKLVTIFSMAVLYYLMYLVASFIMSVSVFGFNGSFSVIELLQAVSFQLLMIFLLLVILLQFIFILKNTHLIITSLFMYPVVVQLVFILLKTIIIEDQLMKIAEFEPLTLFSNFGSTQTTNSGTVYMLVVLLIIIFLFTGNLLFKKSELR